MPMERVKHFPVKLPSQSLKAKPHLLIVSSIEDVQFARL